MSQSDERPLLIGLIRVSTDKQAESGLGLDAQTAAIERHRQSTGGEIIETYEEVESGKHHSIESRPMLRAAVEHALEVDAVLVFAKFDRLVRSTAVMQYLKDRKVRFVACDNPYANELTVDILVAVAANEARMISQRTKDALKAYRDGKRVSKRIREMYPDGVPPEIAEATAGKLGAALPQCRNLTPEGTARGQARSLEVRRARADRHAEAVGRLIRAWRAERPRITLAALARKLNEARRRAPRGGKWTGKQVGLVLARLGLPAKPAVAPPVEGVDRAAGAGGPPARPRRDRHARRPAAFDPSYWDRVWEEAVRDYWNRQETEPAGPAGVAG
jgi:DNA invertase Pin-like site-specific DNA recombinase